MYLPIQHPKRLFGLPVAATYALLGVVFAILLVISLRWGIGVSHDSIQYLGQAELRAFGAPQPHTAVIDWLPPTHYPPLYPMTLSVLIRLGMDAQTAALALNALLLVLVIWVGAWITLRSTRNAYAGLLAGVMLGISGPVLGSFVHAWSEPGFLLLALIIWGLTASQIREPHWGKVLLLAFFMLLIPMQRYAGVAVVGSSLLTLLFWGSGPIYFKLPLYGLMGIVSVLPTMIWGMIQPKVEGYTFRKIGWMGLRDEHRNGLVETFYSWSFPGKPGFWIMLAVMSLVMSLFVLWALRTKAMRVRTQNYLLTTHAELTQPLQVVMVVFLFFYITFLAVSISFMDNATPFDNRILLPAYAAFCLLAIKAAFWPENQPKVLRYALMCLVLLTAVTQVFHGKSALRTAYKTGNGFTSSHFKDGPLQPVLRLMHNAPAGTIFFAEGNEGYDMFYLKFISGRKIYGFGSIADLPMLKKNAADSAYVVFLAPCCPEGEVPKLPNFQVKISAIVPFYYYGITPAQNPTDSLAVEPAH